MNFAISPATLGILLVLASLYVGYFVGKSRGRLAGFRLGVTNATQTYTHILIHALSPELMKEVDGAVNTYLSDPKNAVHIKGGPHEDGSSFDV